MLKRPRTTEQQSNKQTFNQMISQSTNQAAIYSLLYDRALFSYVCSFLKLRDKSGLLSIISEMSQVTHSPIDQHDNRSIRALFDWSACCKDDILVLHWLPRETQTFESCCMQQIAVAHLLRHVHINLVKPIKMDQYYAITSLMQNIASNKMLETLCIYANDEFDFGDKNDEERALLLDEKIVGFAHTFLNTVFKNGQTLSKLKKLHCKGLKVDAIDWNVWDLLSNLEDIEFVLSDWSSTQNNDNLPFMLTNLPSSLKHLTITLRGEQNFDWDNIFCSPDLVPHLETFRFKRVLLNNCEVSSLHALNSTIMTKTGVSRPIQQLLVGDINRSQLESARFNCITVLHVEMFSSTKAINFADDVLPNLKVFMLYGTNKCMVKTVDSLLIFLARRPIQRIDLRECGAISSVAGVRALATMQQLIYLHISLSISDSDEQSLLFWPHHLSRHVIDKHLPINSLPNLKHLRGDIDVLGWEFLLRAAPSLKQAYVLRNDNPDIIALIGRYCPLIESMIFRKALYAEKCFHRPPIDVSVLESLFQRHPSHTNAFQNLVHVGMRKWPSDGMSTQALHYLMTMFQHSSKLQLFDPPALSTRSRTLASFVILRALPHVLEFRGKRGSEAMALYLSSQTTSVVTSHGDSKRVKLDDQKLYVQQAAISAEKWPHEVIEYWIEAMRPSNTSLLSDLDGWKHPMDLERLNAYMHWFQTSDDYSICVAEQNRYYYKFRTDGRASFLQALYSRLTRTHKAQLKKWDAGLYTKTSAAVEQQDFTQNDIEDYSGEYDW